VRHKRRARLPSLDRLRKAICVLEDEIAELNVVVAAPQNATQPADKVPTLQPSRRGFDSTRRRVVWHADGGVVIHKPALPCRTERFVDIGGGNGAMLHHAEAEGRLTKCPQSLFIA
jgi:hypothetical protein